jgi:hypothetical protein
MDEYSFVNVRIDLCKGNEDSVLVYEQRFLVDWLTEKSPNWLSEVIATLNNLEIKNGN